jgi:putative flippase GtrA
MAQIARSVDRALAGPMVRYGATGGLLAVLYAGVYWAGATLLHAPAQLANAAGFMAALIAGYGLHSRWSFRGHGRRSAWSGGRFLAVNLAGKLLNAIWVWLIVQRLGQRSELAIVPIVTLTPAFTFLVNRRWTFA